MYHYCILRLYPALMAHLILLYIVGSLPYSQMLGWTENACYEQELYLIHIHTHTHPYTHSYTHTHTHIYTHRVNDERIKALENYLGGQNVILSTDKFSTAI
jgi:hypothetical protein